MPPYVTTNSVALAKISFQKLHPNECYSWETWGGGLAQAPPGMGRVNRYLLIVVLADLEISLGDFILYEVHIDFSFTPNISRLI